MSAAITIEHEFVPAKGVRLHVARAGSGPLILFLHGFPEFWYCWRGQLEAFGGEFLAVAPDLRGCNLSDKPAGPEAYHVKTLVADICALADHYGAAEFTLVAHDWGGALAWSVAARHPERVRRLVVLNAPHPVTFARELIENPRQIEASQYMTLFRLPKAERVLLAEDCARLFRMMLGAGGRDWMTPEDRAAYRAAWTRPGALTGALNYYRASPLYPAGESGPGAVAARIEPAQHVVRVPTLVIWGEADPALLPGNLAGLDALVPNLRIARISEASHWLVHEQGPRITQLIREFIS